LDKAIVALESVVRDNPTYKDSLTLLGRAYYGKERYQDAYAILQRALAVNKDDEIAWLTLGLTQMRIEENEKGLETLKGAITLLSKVSVSGYRDFATWDSNHVVRASIRRTVLLINKGLEAKADLIRTTETLLSRMDDEENSLRILKSRAQQRLEAQ